MAINPDSLLVRLMAPAWLLACLVFGGSSSGGALVNGLLQIGAGAIIVWMIQRGVWSELDRSARLLLAIMTAAVLLALLTLAPLPPALWKLLGGRDAVFDAYALIGMPAPWLPVSLAPDATIATLFSFLPPVAMFLLVRACPPGGRRAAVITLAAAAFASVLFGVVQQVAGFRSDTYIYQYTSRGGAVGFFANRNHLATLCLMTMPFLAALAAMARRKGQGAQPGGWAPMAGALLLLVVGTLAVQSLAGWILLPPTLLACVLVFQRPRQGRWLRALAVGLAVVAAVAILATLFAPWSSADLDRLGSEVRPQERQAIMGLTWQAAQHFWPFGAGWGSFAEIYRQFEDPAAITGTFVNHAHNDYLELLLEAGMFGVALVLAILVWWAARMRETWRTGGDPIARAATVSIGVVVAHSFVDYPLRTAAIACAAALCCGLAGMRTAAAEPRRREHERTTSTIMLGPTARAGRPARTPVAPQ